MVLQRWDSFRELRRMEVTMNRLRKGFGGDGLVEVGRWAIPLDIVHEGDDIVVKATLPGIKREDIEVSLEDSVLTIKGETREEHEDRKDNYVIRERRTGKFHRALRLPNTVDTEMVESKYEDGVLSITLPKVEAKKAKRLEIKAA